MRDAVVILFLTDYARTETAGRISALIDLTVAISECGIELPVIAGFTLARNHRRTVTTFLVVLFVFANRKKQNALPLLCTEEETLPYLLAKLHTND